MMWRRGSPGRTTTRAVRYWMASSTLPFLPMMRPESGPSISMRISSAAPSPSFGARFASTSICILPTSTRTKAGAFSVCMSAAVSSTTGDEFFASSDTSLSLSQRRGRCRALVLVLLLVRLVVGRDHDVLAGRCRPDVRKQPLGDQLLGDAEQAVGQHVHA